jgi:transposase
MLLLDKGWTSVQIAEAFFLEISTIAAVLKAYKTSGIVSLYAEDISGRTLKPDAAQREELGVHLSTTHDATSQEVRDYVTSEYEVAYSRAGIIAFLKAPGFVHQNTTLIAPAVCETVQQEAIDADAALKYTLPADEVIVHVDGVTRPTWQKTGKVWVKKVEKFTFMNNLTIDAQSSN